MKSNNLGRAVISAIITRYAEADQILFDAVRSLAQQRGVNLEILVLDQRPHDAIMSKLLSLQHKRATVRYFRIPESGLSRARNFAVSKARGKIALFLDCDAIADSDWAITLTRSLSLKNVAIVGSRILPTWRERPPIAVRSQLIKEQYSLLDLGQEQHVVGRIVGAGFGLHIECLGQDAYFDEGLGRRRGLLFGGEESELCDRAKKRGLLVLYDGQSVVHHQIFPERLNYLWIFRRIFFAGVNRRISGGLPSPKHTLNVWDWLFLPFILPIYACGVAVGLKYQARARHVEDLERKSGGAADKCQAQQLGGCKGDEAEGDVL